jgi:hypothetical protein
MSLSPAAIRARAGSRCECRKCPIGHKGRCRHQRDALVTGRHPVALHIHDGHLVCHLCLDRKLQAKGTRLYPEIIPLSPTQGI